MFFRLLFLLLALSQTRAKVIPAQLVQGKNPGERAFAIDMWVGTPPQLLTFEITFKHGIFILYRNQKLHSSTFSERGGLNDFFYVGTQKNRMKFDYDPTRIARGEESHCNACHGMLGLGAGSFFHQIWPDILYTKNSVMLEKFNQPFESEKKGCLVSCDVDRPEISICSTRAVLLNYLGIESTEYKVDFSLDNPNTYLPRHLYDRFMQGRNVYDKEAQKWPPMKLKVSRIDNQDPHEKADMLSKGINTDHSVDTMTINFEPDDFIREVASNHKVLLLHPNENGDNTTITLGNSILNDFSLYKSVTGRYLFIFVNEVPPHLSAGLLVLFLIIFTYWLIWKLTFDRQSKQRQNVKKITFFGMFLEITAPFLTLTALLLPFPRNVMESFPALRIGVIVIFVYAVVVKAIYLFYVLSGRLSKNSYYHIFKVNFLRNLSHEIILMIGLWVSVLERRTEGVGNFLTLIINFFILYTISYYFILFLEFQIYSGTNASQGADGSYSLTWLSIMISVPLLLGFQVFATHFFFATPIILRSAQLYEELILPTLILTYILLVILARYIVSAYFHKLVVFLFDQNHPHELPSNPEKTTNNQNTREQQQKKKAVKNY